MILRQEYVLSMSRSTEESKKVVKTPDLRQSDQGEGFLFNPKSVSQFEQLPERFLSTVKVLLSGSLPTGISIDWNFWLDGWTLEGKEAHTQWPPLSPTTRHCHCSVCGCHLPATPHSACGHYHPPSPQKPL